MGSPKPKVIIIGGGVIGTSIAYHLAREGGAVTLLEKGGLASGSSGACDGHIFLQSKKPGIHLELALASRELFQELDRELAGPTEFRKSGGLVAITTRDELAVMEDFAAAQASTGLEVDLLKGEPLRRLCPALSPDILGATYSPLDGQVNPIRLTLALGRGAAELGAEVLTGQEVTGLERAGSGTWRVATPRKRFQAERVVLAGGALTPKLGSLLGLEIPIKPRRGQILVTEPAEPLLPMSLITAGYIAAKFNPEIAARAGQGVSMEQTEAGSFLLGSTREFVGFDRRTRMRDLAGIARRAGRIIPALAELSAIRSFAGLRPYTPDGLPILGPVPGREGLFIASGHEGDGIALAPVTGRLMARLILGRRPETDPAPFSLERFDDQPGEVS